SRRQWAERGLRFRQRALALVAVDVEHQDAAIGTGGDADVVFARPPATDNVFVRGRGAQVVVDQRLLAAHFARKDAHALPGKRQRRIAKGAHAAPSRVSSAGRGYKVSTARQTAAEKASRLSRPSNSRIGLYCGSPVS